MNQFLRICIFAFLTLVLLSGPIPADSPQPPNVPAEERAPNITEETVNGTTPMPVDEGRKQKKIEQIKEFVLGFGPWAFWVYVALYVLNTMTLIPPIFFMTLAGGAIFGPVVGSMAIFLGCILGTTATFFISRLFGRRFVEKIVKGRAKDFEEKLNKQGFLTILIFRLVAFPPWEVVNYGSGLTKIKYRDFILATAIGIIPAIVIQVYLADRAVNFDIRDPKVIAQLLLAIGLFVFLGFIPKLYDKFKKKQTVS